MHRFVDEIVFGKSFSEVHRTLDGPYKYLGRKHRRVFHTLAEAFAVGYLSSSDSSSAAAGVLHVRLDEACSKNKKLRKFLEAMQKSHKRLEKKERQLEKKLRQAESTTTILDINTELQTTRDKIDLIRSQCLLMLLR
jgi:hypothetical protein